jgi:DNA-3-methyladenine glycosylase II
MQLRKRKQAIEATAEPMKVVRVGVRALTDHFRARKSVRVQTAAGKVTASKVTITETAHAVSVAADSLSPQKSAARKRSPNAVPAPEPVLAGADGAAAQEVNGPLAAKKSPQRRKRTAKATAAVDAAAPDALATPPLPPLTHDSIATGMAHIASAHPRLAELVAEYGPPRALAATEGSTFASLAHSIVSQQLATSAARTIFGRFLLACKCDTEASPEAVLATPLAELRAAGLSGQKAGYITDLAAHYADGRITDVALAGMNEAELVAALTSVKGIGPWTADMFMMFFAGRPDVLPVGDLGVRKGFQILFSLKELPDAAKMEALAASWRPWRSIGSWYMWKLCEAEGRKSPTKAKKVKKAATEAVEPVVTS